MSEHTLTPWHCVPTISPDDDPRIVYYPIHDENGVSICHVRAIRPASWDSHNPNGSILKAKADDDLIASGRIPSLSQAEGYVHFIVRACNAHKDLLETCSAVCARLAGLANEYGSPDRVGYASIPLSRLEDVASAVRAAIAKATK